MGTGSKGKGGNCIVVATGELCSCGCREYFTWIVCCGECSGTVLG